MTLTESKLGGYSYSCVMAALSATDRFDIVRKLTSQIDPMDLVWEDGLGAELDPHVTALYGLHEQRPEPFVEALSKIHPFEVTFKGLSTFDGAEYDVLKLDVESKDLVQLSRLLRRKFKYTNSFPDYHPHLTIGYVKKGSAQKYFGMEFPLSATIEGFVFSSSNKLVGKVGIECQRRPLKDVLLDP